MPDPHVHLTDAELLMAADGELPKRRSAQVRFHLDSCWSCRERMRSLEETITGFVRARNAELGNSIPSPEGPRALLRARLAESRTAEAPPGTWSRPVSWRLVAAGACLCVLLGFVVFERAVSAEGPRPDLRITPGETRPITLAEACRNPEAQVVVRDIPAETQRQVLAIYGINAGKPGEFEVDYLITPDLGGADSVRNLWPQPYSARWNAKAKDRLEQRLHDLVCVGKIDLATAQHEIARDWIGAYKKYVGGVF